MTDADRYAVIGQVVSEHEQAKRDLAALRENAVKVGNLLQAFGHAIAWHHSTGHRQKDPKGYRIDGEQIQASSRDHHAYGGTYPTLAALTALLSEIDEKVKLEAELGARRRGLGV